MYESWHQQKPRRVESNQVCEFQWVCSTEQLQRALVGQVHSGSQHLSYIATAFETDLKNSIDITKEL